MGFMESKYVPWSEPKEWVVWLFALILATFIIHNIMRRYHDPFVRPNRQR